jgi:uncharacterized protein with NRDE domain
MCVVAVALRAHPRYPLIIAGNRDEFYQRETAAANWWPDAPDVFGGRDLVAGGSWLAINRQGRFALVTNQPARPPGPEHGSSRGSLVRNWVTGSGDLSTGYLQRIQATEAAYAGFCLVAGTATGKADGLVVPAGPVVSRWQLADGITALSNGPPDQLPLKAQWLEEQLQKLLGADTLAAEQFLAPLARKTPLSTGWRRLDLDDWRVRSQVTPFVLGDNYGTRATTVVMVNQDGRCRFIEQRFGPQGTPLGVTDRSFELDRRDPGR